MRRRLGVVVAFGLLVAACTTAEGDVRASGTTPAGAEPTGPTAVEPTGPSGPTGSTGSPGQDLPEPDARVPRDPRRLAETLTTTWTERRATADAWIASSGTRSWPPPEELELLVLFEQRIYRVLARDARLAERVLDRLPRGLAAEGRFNVDAGSALFHHFRPVSEVPDFRIRAPESADRLRGYFEVAQERFGVDWELLAAVMLIETRMGRIVSRSSAGAQGPMQFLPATWEAYGLGGDVHDPRDAVMGAANYLRASGAPGDVRQALYRYNPVDAYVTAVSRYARSISRDPLAYYAYYNWQVFVRTKDGDVRLSGPGLPP